MNNIILKVDGDAEIKTYYAETEFDEVELQDAVELIREDLEEITSEDEDITSEAIFKVLQDRKYIKITGEAPEIIELVIF